MRGVKRGWCFGSAPRPRPHPRPRGFRLPGVLSCVLTGIVSDPFTIPPAERFGVILRDLREALAAQGVRGALTGWLLILTVGRLNRAAQRVMAIAARLAAGTLRPPRPPLPHPPLPHPPSRPPMPMPVPVPAPPAPPAAPAPPRPRLPQRFGWLLRRLLPQETARCRVANHRSQLAHLLAQPDMVALIEAAPAIGRQIRPVCRMLGLTPPPPLRLPPRPRPPRPGAANSPRPPKPARPRLPRKSRLRRMDDYGPPSRPGWERPVRHFAGVPAPPKRPGPA